jgi:hypothetical protein
VTECYQAQDGIYIKYVLCPSFPCSNYDSSSVSSVTYRYTTLRMLVRVLLQECFCPFATTIHNKAIGIKYISFFRYLFFCFAVVLQSDPRYLIFSSLSLTNSVFPITNPRACTNLTLYHGSSNELPQMATPVVGWLADCTCINDSNWYAVVKRS